MSLPIYLEKDTSTTTGSGGSISIDEKVPVQPYVNQSIDSNSSSRYIAWFSIIARCAFQNSFYCDFLTFCKYFIHTTCPSKV